MSWLNSIEDFFDEDAKYERAFYEGFDDGESAFLADVEEAESIQEQGALDDAYDAGFEEGYGDGHYP